MALHEIHHDGFHGHTVLRFRGKKTTYYRDGHTERRVEVSRRVAKRLNDAVCGMRDCQCGSVVAVQEYGSDDWYVVVKSHRYDEGRMYNESA